MPNKAKIKLNKLLVIAILLSLFTAQAGLAQGYLGKSYNLSDKKAQNTARIQIDDIDAPDKVFKLDFSFSTRGSDVQDDNVKATTSTSLIGIEFDWNVTKTIKAQFIGGMQFASGNHAILYGTEAAPGTGPAYDEVSFTYSGIPKLDLSAGVVNTEFNPISSTFAGGGFAGFRQVIDLNSGIFVGSIKGFQVAPSSSGTANRALDDEKNPFLTVANLNVGIKTDRFSTNLGYSKFDFYGLTSASAKDSRYLGNTIAGIGEDAYYTYKFRGQEIAANAQLKLRLDDKLTVSGNLTQNDAAIKRRNQGFIARTSYEYNFGRYSIRPGVTRFRFEPDVIPAFGGYSSFGFLNRDGYMGEIRGSLKKYKLDGYVRYMDAKEIDSNSAQSDRTSVTVGMEVKYEIL